MSVRGGINKDQRAMDCGEAGHIQVARAADELQARFADWPSMFITSERLQSEAEF